MSIIGSSLSKSQDGTPLFNASVLGQIAGVPKDMTRAQFDAAITQERANITNNGAGIWANGEKIGIFGELGIRIWYAGTTAALSHARNVTYQGQVYALATDAGVFGPTSGAPTNGVGANGDYMADGAAGLVYGPKAGGAWPAATAAVIVPPAAPASSIIDGTYTASGAIDPTKAFVVLSSSSALAMSLANSTAARSLLIIKNLGSAAATVSLNLDTVSNASLVILPKGSATLAWSVALATYALVGQFDPGQQIGDLATATLVGTQRALVFEADGTPKNTTLSALSTFLGGSSSGGGTTAPVPGTPTVTVTAPTSSSLTVAVSASNSPTSYQIQRSTSSTFASGITTISNASTASVIDNGLTAATVYYYRASATNAGGTSGYSAIVSGTTGAASYFPINWTGSPDGAFTGKQVLNSLPGQTVTGSISGGVGTVVGGADYYGGTLDGAGVVTDGTITISFPANSVPPGIIFRADRTNKNYYQLAFSNGVPVLLKSTNGSLAAISPFDGTSVISGTASTVGVRFVGSTITVVSNGADTNIARTDTSFASGLIGLAGNTSGVNGSLTSLNFG